MKTAVKKIARPAPGVRPDITGVPGELVPLAGLDLHFGKSLRTSPYDPLLEQLDKAGPGNALRFGDLRARVSVVARAKKLGLHVSFAVSGNTLYVRLDGRAADDKHATRREQIKAALKFGPLAAMKLTALLREKGDATVDASLVENILGQMMRAGEVVHQEGGAWALAPKVK